ncbi:hypothetical protein M1615_01505 [Patescibacteria group bacterium]|nr:hypothetical protein [Patescibacteria group bacterium]MCL5010263.1 hypothetical protein [Patescibacteria group bacterium]
MPEPAITVVIRKKQSLLFEGLIRRVSSYNEKGEFDIYPYHANFVAVISQFLELEKLGGKKEIVRFPLEKGILLVKEDRVEIYQIYP